ncbi:putative tail tubular protein A [uncultured Mediterranean phage uvMED]|jgi:hypothetical protein|nr:putative tail tubular protein A [uncultured Mediterranean phage uvMED]BAR18575.1 putative tail tubular protein A [uncultured Mediterranean phage uvMED]BAR18600.1 putative tail tubular protein A [uncultured Mediterranean phage uvMED]BAR18707.1 putative tail tubular protein A [uncultured Mediterranean phage uvMED]BAR18837.1 putative tail tubular protein A [uncultured Mediterranean phage uvMED]|tara:strand:- start:118 stop:795 length:678 start_codon:yes stop_codon:yes gene_type:complete
MALSNYSELQSSVANWLNRSDLTTEITGDFIVLTEKDFNSKLRIRKMVESDSSFSINAETVALPSGFLQVRDLFILSGGTKYALTYMTPPQMDQIKGSSTSGMPVAYTIIGDNFRFAPTPDSTYTGTLNYYKSFDALSDSNTTNYILTNHPAIYLYGSLYHAANFLGGVEPARLQQWQGMYTTALERLERNDREDQFSGSPLQIRSDVTVASSFQDTTKVTNNNT